EGAGYVSVTLSEDGSSLDYRLYANGLVDMTMAHIHVGAEGENGPPLVFLFGPADPPMTSDGLLAEDTIVEADLIPVEGVFDGTMAQLIELIRSGNTYVNVHTAANPAGEIRGQLELASFNFAAPLAGSNEVPAVDTTGTGFSSLALDDSQAALDYRLVTYGLEGIVMAHIHVAPPGVNGPVAVFL